ncbi:NAD(P)H-binding protein [Microbacterium sp. ARD32]|uniref:SDR family oxidoreductase n=1 Tax=Microbacterium sp. ARD32 TaxID=2962577 RepID=UPI002880EE02|nr:NAD(P)H-binding protein [Microbacterium sp. ARD32]MDT0158292.1 NAD(P)H-binding protein [Microbacterium sp. ARD32]
MAEFIVVGGTGQIGAKTVNRLRARGRSVAIASPSTGVDLVTGSGLDEALAGAEVVIDASKPRSGDPASVREFFSTGVANLLDAEREHGIRHHLGLTIVGSERPHDVPFYAAKVHGERLVRESEVPWTLVHATQFFEFAPAIATMADAEGAVTLPEAMVQPAAGADVADVLVQLALAAPLNADAEIAGPERMPLAGFVTRVLRARGDQRVVRAAPDGRYFGGTLDAEALLPGPEAVILPTRLDDWLRTQNDREHEGTEA